MYKKEPSSPKKLKLREHGDISKCCWRFATGVKNHRKIIISNMNPNLFLPRNVILVQCSNFNTISQCVCFLLGNTCWNQIMSFQEDSKHLYWGLVVEQINLQVGMPTFHIRVLGLSPGYSVLPIQLLANIPGRQQKMVQVFGFLPPMWETLLELLTLDLDLAVGDI